MNHEESETERRIRQWLRESDAKVADLFRKIEEEERDTARTKLKEDGL